MVEFIGLFLCIPLYTAAYLIFGVYVTAGILTFHIAAVPLIFKYSKTFRRNLIFANAFQWPLKPDFEDPDSTGLEGARNLYLNFHSKVDNCEIKIGIWQILPSSARTRLGVSFDSLDAEEHNKLMNTELINAKTPIIMYCHGNSSSRAASHRLMLYKFLQRMDFHTIAFDYRGYADSTNVSPSEAGVVEDALVVYDWLMSVLDKGQTRPPVFVWGHSLGTGIASHLLGNLQALCDEYLDRQLRMPNGLILEAPFNNIVEEVAEHPLTPFVRWLPYFDAAIVEPFRGCPEYSFTSDLHLQRVKSLPILILHAEDDRMVPATVGLRLYHSIVKSRRNGDATVIFHHFDKKESLGHKYICMAKDLPDIVGDFVKSHQR